MQAYADETGNSGADIFDAAQPIFVVAVLFGEASSLDALVGASERLRQTHRVQMSELKGGRLLRSAPGQRFLTELAAQCVAMGVQVGYVACHKPFMAAGVIIEDCTDHIYNPRFPPEFTGMAQDKEMAAQMVLNAVDQQVLLRWWRSRQGDNLSDFEAAHASLVASLRASSELADFGTALTQVDLNAILADRRSGLMGARGDYSPNSITFPMLLQCLEASAVSLGVPSVILVHDEQAQYQDVFRFQFDLMRNAADETIELPNGNVLRLRLSRITTLHFASSQTELRLQLSDCLAALARRVLQADYEGNPGDVSESFRSALNAIRYSNRASEFPWVVGPLQWKPRAVRLLWGERV